MDVPSLLRAIRLRTVIKSFQSFDRPSLWGVGLSWVVAFLMMAIASYTFHLASVTKRESAIQMDLVSRGLHVEQDNIDSEKAQLLIDQFKKNYPELHFMMTETHSLIVSTNEGSHFREWLLALNDLDASNPDLRWSLDAFCVGKCPNHNLMTAVLSAQNIHLSKP